MSGKTSVREEGAGRSLAGRLVQGVLWTTGGWAASRIASVLATLFIARWLGKEPYGQFAAIQGTVGLFSIFAGIGLGTTASRYVSHLKNTDEQRVARVCGFLLVSTTILGSVAGIVQWLLASHITQALGATGDFVRAVRLSAVLILLYALDGVQSGILNGLEKFPLLAVIAVSQGIVNLCFSVLLTYHFGLQGAVLALVLTALTSSLLSGACLAIELGSGRCPITFHRVWEEARILWEFSVPMLLNSLVLSCSYLLCLGALARDPSCRSEAGVFALGRQIGLWIQVVPQILLRVLLPILSTEAAQQRGRVTSLTAAIHGFYMISCFPISALAICTISSVLRLAAPAFLPDGGSIAVLLAASAFGVARGASELALIADGRAWVNSSMSFLWNSVMVLGAFAAVALGEPAVVFYVTAGGLLLTTSIGNRVASKCFGLPRKMAWQTDVIMLLLLLAALASNRWSLAAWSPLIAAVLFALCLGWLVPKKVWAAILAAGRGFDAISLFRCWRRAADPVGRI